MLPGRAGNCKDTGGAEVLSAQNLKGRSIGGIESGGRVISMARAFRAMRRMNSRCSNRMSIEFTEGGVRLKKR